MITDRTVDGFAAAAERAWRTLAPGAYAAIDDKPGFFRVKGEAALGAWSDMVNHLAFPPGVPRGTTTLEEAGRIEAIRLRADELIQQEYLDPPVEDRETSDPGDLITLRDFTPAVGRWVELLRRVMLENVGAYPSELDPKAVQVTDPVTGKWVTVREWDDEIYSRLEDTYGASQDAILDAMRTWADQNWEPRYDTPANRVAFDELIPAHPRVSHDE